jgi:hypothetical protein
VRARPATSEDLLAVRAIAEAYGDLWTTRPDYLDHELRHGRLVVGEEDDRIVAYGAALERSGIDYLADLFVLPPHLGRGAGRAILGELFPQRGDRYTFASSDSRALPLYVRFGMRPFEPVLYLAGERAAATRLGGAPRRLRQVDPMEVVAIDETASGRRRPDDHEFLRSAGATALVGATGGMGYGYVRIVPGRDGGTDALLGPSGVSGDRPLAELVSDLVSWAGQRAERIRVAVLGSFPGLGDLFAAGFRVTDQDTFMASAPGMLDGTRYQPSPVIG